MNALTTTLLVIAGLVVLVLVGVFLYKQEQKRRAEFSALSAQHGWSFTPHSRDHGRRYRGDPFGHGSRRQGRYVMEGRYREQNVTVLEYSYTTQSGSGKNRRTRTHRFSVAGRALPGEFPTLQLTREHAGTRLIGAVGLRDLQLESEQFNHTFRINADDDRFAYDVLHARTMEWMLADPRFSQLPFRFERADLMTWDDGRLTPQRATQMLDLLVDVRERVPGFVLERR